MIKGKKIRIKNKPIVYNRSGSIIPKNLLFRAVVFFLIVNIMLFTLGTTDFFTNARVNPQESNDNLHINEQIHSEEIVDIYTDSIGIGSFTKHSIISFNITVLPQSNSSVEFVFYYYYLNYTVWSPDPGNFTLGIGESFAGNFTLITALSSNTALFAFYTCVSSGGTNATVHYWYEVLVTGKTPAAGFLILSGSLVFLSLCIIISTKRKAVRIKH